MKTLKALLLTGIFLLSYVSYAQKATQDTLVVKSSTQCGMCKENIEKALAYEKGVKTSNVDYKKKTVTVVYNPSKTTPDAIRKAISKVGYDADNVSADPKAYEKLSPCCKKGGHDAKSGATQTN